MFRRTPPAASKNGHKNGNGSTGNGNGHSSENGNGNGHHPEEVLALPKAPLGIDTVLGANANFNGTIVSPGGVRIDGGFDGVIEIKGALVIGDGARVISETIRAQSVTVGGSVKGNIIAEKVEILSTGRIYGDLTVVTFVTEEGAVLRGNIVMQDAVEIGDETMPIAA